GEYHVKLTSKNGCVRTDTVLIGSVKPLPSFFLPPDTVICAGEVLLLHPGPSYKSYYWSNGETGDSILVNDAGVYSLQVTDGFGCTGNDTIRVETKKCPYGIYFPNAFTPNKDGRNDVFRPVILGHPLVYHFDIYNRWGQQVFETTDPKNGWDGMLKRKDQESEAFIWVCIFQFAGEKKTVKKGSFLLLR
ncbi:MAG TPA: gliding motility-associated C-terminal domain-containing protein, partial [Puia sp.]